MNMTATSAKRGPSALPGQQGTQAQEFRFSGNLE